MLGDPAFDFIGQMLSSVGHTLDIALYVAVRRRRYRIENAAHQAATLTFDGISRRGRCVVGHHAVGYRGLRNQLEMKSTHVA